MDAQQAKGLSKLASDEGGATVSAPKDTAKMHAVIAATDAAEVKLANEMAAREGELRKVAVTKADAEFIAAQFDVTYGVADRTLRLHGGDLRKAVDALLGSSR